MHAPLCPNCPGNASADLTRFLHLGILAVMKAKYLVLVALLAANYPFYRALFRLLFRGMGKDGVPKLSDFRDPDFLHDGGGENKLFLLVLASLLLVLIEYYVLLSIFPGLRDAVLLGLAACRAAISC